MGKRKAFAPSRSRADTPVATETRTVALVGHRSAGKTSLGEVLLRVAGVTRTVGSVDRRTSLLDHHEEERRRGQSLQLSFAWFDWQGAVVHLIDTPGSEVALSERVMGLHAADAAILVVDATAGVEVGTETNLEEARRLGKPVLVALSKVDRRVEIEGVLQELQALVDARVVPLFLPFEEEGILRGVVSVLDEQVCRYDPDGAATFSPEPLPLRLETPVQAARERLTDAVAMADDALLEEYLEYLELPRQRLEAGLVQAVARGDVLPVLVTSAHARIGAQPLLNAVLQLLPGPLPAVVRDADGAERALAAEGPFVAQLVSSHLDGEGDPYHVLRVWSGAPRRGPWTHIPAGDPEGGRSMRIQKLYRIRGPRRATAQGVGPGALVATWEPLEARVGDTFTSGERLMVPLPSMPPLMMSQLVLPSSGEPDARELELLEQAAERLVRRDPGLRAQRDPDTGGVLLSGLSAGHLDLTVDRLRQVTGLSLDAELPPVGYRETPVEAVQNVQGLHVRESGDGLVQEYGLCTVDVRPAAPERGIAFQDTLPPDDIDMLPAKYRPAIDEGVRRASAHGPTAGYPVVGVEVTLVGGEYDILQSTDDHFRRAGENALRIALQRAGTRLLEPWSHVEVEAPQAAVGDLLSDIASHRGRVLGMDTVGDGNGRAVVRIEAVCPVRELRTFGARLQAHTAGRGRFVSRHSHYEPLPAHLEHEAIAASPFRRRASASARHQG